VQETVQRGYTREQALAWSREGASAPSVLAWADPRASGRHETVQEGPAPSADAAAGNAPGTFTMADYIADSSAAHAYALNHGTATILREDGTPGMRLYIPQGPIDEGDTAGNVAGNSPVMFDAGDVRITKIDDYPCDCCMLDAVATHEVRMDLRAIGETDHLVGRYCEACAKEMAGRLKASLPKEADHV